MDSEDRSTQKDKSSSAGASSLSDLIARLEKAQGPDRELDIAIFRTMSPHARLAGDNRVMTHNDVGYLEPVANFTSSIDAAMTLVPEGWFTTICRDERPGFANVHRLVNNEGPCNYARAATPAIALCLAALKARSLPAI